MQRYRDLESLVVFNAETGGGSGGSTGGEGTGSPSGGGDAGGGEKSGGEGGAPGGQQKAADTGGTGDAKKTFDETYVRELRAENAKHRTAAAAAEAKLKALEDEKLSDTEKREKRMKELEADNARLVGESRKSAILAQAAAAGAIVPEAIVGLVPADAEDYKKAIAEVKREYADLFRKPTAGSADAGAGTGDDKQKQRTESISDQIRRATGVL
jgi:hypothetical protein